MSGEIYQVEVGFPDWVDSTEDEALVGAAIGFGALKFVLNSKASCKEFVTKRNLSVQQECKY